MSFLSGIGRAIRAPGFGDRLQAGLAAAQGDTGAIQRLRALQLQQAELQRQNDALDAQVIGAKNMGFTGDEIDGMGGPEMSAAVRQRALARMFGADAGAGGGEGSGTSTTDPAPQPAPTRAAPSPAIPQPARAFAAPTGAPPYGATFTSERLRSLGPPGFAGGSMENGVGLQAAPFAGPRLGQAASPGNLPSVQTHSQATSLPRGTFFVAPDGSIRRTM
jgi:hypothetical protein